MELDEVWAERLEKWRYEIRSTKIIFIPVIFNMFLTLIGWYFVYDCETDPNSIAYYLLDSRRNFTTGSDIYDGALNSVMCISLLAAMSFFMLLVAIYNFKRLIQAWLSISCLLIMFVVSAAFLRDVFLKVGATEHIWIWTLLSAGIYGAGGVAVFFSEKCPLWLHQLYIVINCSIVSLYYLRMLPAHTTWFLLSGVIMWDAFAVLAPNGPLKLVNECAGNYSDNILRFLMFTAKIQPVDNFDDDDEHGCTTAKTISDSSEEEECKEVKEEVVEEKRERTAKEALDDQNSIRLGLGDFVFYSVLVGKAASSKSFLATMAAMNGVVLGLVITFTVFADYDETMPALPCSIALGMLFHFGTLYVIQPFYYYIYNLFFLLLSDGIFALGNY